MAVSKRTRYEVLRRDNHACRYCGASAPDVTLVVDHVTPVALGGTDDPSNLVAACRDCNSGKASTSPDDRKKRDAYARRFLKAWNEWGTGPLDDRKRLPLPGDWKPTMWQFYGLGLPIHEVEDAVTIAAGNKKVYADDVYRYMCGVLWNKVTRMQEGAKALLEAGDA